MSTIVWTVFFAILAAALFLLQPSLSFRTLRSALGLAFFLQLFYIMGHYLSDWPFPTPLVIIQIFIIVALGVALGGVFSRVWPIPARRGFERVIRTVLLAIPALGLGIGFQVLLQGNQPTQALYLIFALAAWLGSGQNVRKQ